MTITDMAATIATQLRTARPDDSPETLARHIAGNLAMIESTAKETEPSLRQRLFDLLDAALAVPSMNGIWLYESRTPGAAAALDAWADARGLRRLVNSVGAHEAETAEYRVVATVYVERAA